MDISFVGVASTDYFTQLVGICNLSVSHDVVGKIIDQTTSRLSILCFN